MHRMLCYNQHYCLLLITLLITNFSLSLSWDYNKGGADWGASCQKGPQAPLDIAKPFTYRQTNLTFSYSSMMTEYSFYNDGNNLILEGDFGFMEYNGDTFFSTQIMFYSPSMHTINHEHLPLEMQIIHHNTKNEIVTLSIVFKHSDSDYSLLLGKLHFDQEDLQKMTPFKPIFIKDQINLSKYLHSGQSYFIYDTLETIPPCAKRNTMVILSDILYVSRKQLDNFPMIIRNKNKMIQERGDRKLYATFDIDNIKQLIEDNHQIVSQNSQRKVEETKIEFAETVISSNDTTSLNTTALEANGTSAEEIKQALEKELDKLDTQDQTTVTITKNAKVVPFDLIKERVLAKESTSKKVDLKQLGSAVTNQNETMTIDKDIPVTQSKLTAEDVYIKYMKWKAMKKNATNTTKPMTPQILIELSKLENELSTSSLIQKNFNIKNSDKYTNKEGQNKHNSNIIENPIHFGKTNSKANKHTISNERKQLLKEINDIKTNLFTKQKDSANNDKNIIAILLRDNINDDNINVNKKEITHLENLGTTIGYYERLEDIIKRKYNGLDIYEHTLFKLHTLEKDIGNDKAKILQEHYTDLINRISKVLSSLNNRLEHQKEDESNFNKEKEDTLQTYQYNKLRKITNDIVTIEARLDKLRRMNQRIKESHMSKYDDLDEKITMIQKKLDSIIKIHENLKEEKSNNNNDQLEEIQRKQEMLLNQNKAIIDYMKQAENELNLKLQLIINQHKSDGVNIDIENSYRETISKMNDTEQLNNNTLQDQITKEEISKGEEDDIFSYVRIVKDNSKDDINERIQMESNNKDMLKEKIIELNETIGNATSHHTSINITNSTELNTSINESSEQAKEKENEEDYLEDEEKEEEKKEGINATNIDDNEKLFKDTLLSINEKFQEYKINDSKRSNLKRNQPTLSSSKIDFQIVKILDILFNQLKFKLSSNDKTNAHNSSYYPYLTEEGKIKIFFTSLMKILRYSYQIASIPLIEDSQAMMISKYIEEVLQEQNKRLFSLTPGLYIFNNVTSEEVDTLSRDISKNMQSIDSKKVREMIVSLMINTPFQLINENDLFKQSKLFNTQLSVDECIKGEAQQQQSVTLSKSPDKKDDLDLIVNMKTPDANEEIVVLNKKNKIVVKGSFGSFQQGTHYFDIKAIELYSPSMHVFEETKQRAVMEMVIIGENAYGDYSVVAVMFALGKYTNVFLDSIGINKNNMNSNNRFYTITNDYYRFDLSDMIPSKPNFVSYNGPMISSPFLKDIKWYVLTNNQLILSPEQFYSFSKIFNRNK